MTATETSSVTGEKSPAEFAGGKHSDLKLPTARRGDELARSNVPLRDRNLEYRLRPERLLVAALFLSGGLAYSAAHPEDKARVAKEQLCAACHGADGKSASVRAPVLAGQFKAYLVSQLAAFRDHSRSNGDGRFFMWPMAAGLSDPEIDQLADYFAARPLPGPEPAAEIDRANGKILFEKGAPERGVVACGSCHGDKAQGMAVFPRLAGQHRDYLATQLAAFADGERPNPIMGPLAKGLSRDDIRDLAAYLAAL
jgi:cytochrome c553